jgi:hypothetical protein
MDRDELAAASRRLRARADAILGAVWYMPERHTGFTRLGLSTAASGLGGRAACMGAVRGEVVAAAFGCHEPKLVARAIDEAWATTTPDELLAERLSCARAYLAQVLGEHPDGIERAVKILRPACEMAPTTGHVVFAGLRAQTWPGDPLGDLWRACDMVRERRGDSHVNAWNAAGVDAVEIIVLSESWRQLPFGTVTVSQMGWSNDDAVAARDRLIARELIDQDGALTSEGKAVRDGIEFATDLQEAPLVEAIGADLEELLALLEPWARALLAAAEQISETYATMRRG